MMTKVLVDDDGPGSGFVHKTDGGFIDSEKTSCGITLHPACTTHVPKLIVTCPKCLRLMSIGELQTQLDLAKSRMNTVLNIAIAKGYHVDFKMENIDGVMKTNFKIVRR